MDPQWEKSPGIALPQPSEGGIEGGSAYQMPGHHAPETMPTPPETSLQPAAPTFSGPAPVVAPNPAVPTLPSPQPASMALPAAPADDDNDELDQEWVDKAKTIVERTKNDPFIESREISKAKADYLRTRYNKHIKVAEERAQ
jgi:hypothetical protein